jgi:hypothetical protein
MTGSQTTVPCSLGRQSLPAVLAGSLGQQSWPAVLAGSLGRQSWPAVLLAVLNGSLARQSYRQLSSLCATWATTRPPRRVRYEQTKPTFIRR